jgi:hypothetical protein
MREELLNSIKEIKTNLLSKSHIYYPDETATKQGIILRILSSLGWDVWNTSEVCPEFPVGNGRVDYALRLLDHERVFIEVKKVGAIFSHREEQQILNYAFQRGVKLAILTNGILWKFYLPIKEGTWQERMFCQLDLSQQNEEEITSKLFLLLAKSNIEHGQAFEEAEKLYKQKRRKTVIKQYLPKTWEQLLKNPDDILIDLINDKLKTLCGYTADDEQIKDFLKNQVHLIYREISPNTHSKDTQSSLGLTEYNRNVSSESTKNVFTNLPRSEYMYKFNEWDQDALKKVHAWIIEQLKIWPLNQPISIGDMARQSRKVAHILPDGNRWGFKYLLLKLQEKGLVKLLNNTTFMVLRSPINEVEE